MHDKHMLDVEEEDVELFLRNMEPLHEKALTLLIQLPPSMEVMPGLERLRQLVPLLDNKYLLMIRMENNKVGSQIYRTK